MPNREQRIREILWQRIASGLHRGSLAPGHRLPSTRQLGAELGAAPRTVMAAYAGLARDGLVELRRRSGIYVGNGAIPEPAVSPSADWLVELLLRSRREGIPPRALPGRLAALFEPPRLQVACIAGSLDQADHMCREIRDDYGIAAEPLDSERLSGSRSTAVLRSADLLISTALSAIPAQAMARRFHKPLVVVRLRPEIIADMVAKLRAGPVYFVGTDPRFASALRVIFEPIGWAHHLRPVILGQDDPERIPPTAPVFIMELAHERLGDTPLTRRVKPIAQVFSDETAREIMSHVVQAARGGSAGRQDGRTPGRPEAAG